MFLTGPNLDILPIPDTSRQNGTRPQIWIRNTDFLNTHTSCFSTTKVAKFFSYITIRLRFEDNLFLQSQVASATKVFLIFAFSLFFVQFKWLKLHGVAQDQLYFE